MERIELYKVVGKPIPRTEITPEGTFLKMVEIFFETKSGARDSIVVPVELDVEGRKRLLHEAAKRIEDTLKLKE